MSLIKRLVLTRHALTVIGERKLEMKWIEKTVNDPEWSEPDVTSVGVERRFRAIPDYDGRVLRVVVVETNEEYRIISAFLDRRARKPK